jgi:hypothetical protein
MLSGDPDAIIKIPDHSSWWANPTVGIIQVDDPYNVEISGFKINGNCQNQDPSLASSPGHAHDCMHLIQVFGGSTNFGNNITIHDMTLYDSYSDGLKIYFVNNAHIYKNKIRNTQHECIFATCLIDSIVEYNELQGITSDCLRFDNCVNCDIGYNKAWSYNGSHALNTYMHGENGVQIGDADSSKGYDARNKPTTTKNINFHDNMLIDNGLRAILLDSVALSESANVILQNNTIIGHDALEKSGVPFDIDNYSYENPPNLVESEKVFSSIFDILSMNVQVDNTEHINTQAAVITAHQEAVDKTAEKPLINPITFLFIATVGIFISGVVLNLRVIL